MLLNFMSASAQWSGSVKTDGSWNFKQSNNENVDFKLKYNGRKFYVASGIYAGHNFLPSTQTTSILDAKKEQNEYYKGENKEMSPRKFNAGAGLDFGYIFNPFSVLDASLSYGFSGKNENSRLKTERYNSIDKSVPPFSWMNWIVMCREDYDSGNRHILEHEKAHIRLGHSKEVLLVDILSAFQWFNPAMWLLKRDLRAIHEFEADDAVLRGGANIKEYQYSLIRKAVSASGYSITNSFNHSILKNRITMMSKSNAPGMRGLRVLYILPLVCGALALNAKTVTDYKVSDNSYGEQVQGEELIFEFKKADVNDNRAVNGTILCFEGLPVTIEEARKIVASAAEKGTVSLVFNGEI